MYYLNFLTPSLEVHNIMDKFGIHVTLCMLVGLLFINEGNKTVILHGGVGAAQLIAWLPPTSAGAAGGSGGHRKLCCQLWSPGARDSFGQFFNLQRRAVGTGWAVG